MQRNVTIVLGLLSVLLPATDVFPQWTEMQDAPGGGFFSLIAAEGGTLWAGEELDGLFRSADSGQTWSAVSGMKESNISAFLSLGGAQFLNTRYGLYRSRDLGSSWTRLPQGPAGGTGASCLLAIG